MRNRSKNSFKYLALFSTRQVNIFLLAALGLHCCRQDFSSCGKWALLFLVMCGLLIVVASLVDPSLLIRGLQQLQHAGSVVVMCGSRASRLQLLQHSGSGVVPHGLDCSAACGIFPDQGLYSYPLQCQTNSYPLHCQGSTLIIFQRNVYMGSQWVFKGG